VEKTVAIYNISKEKNYKVQFLTSSIFKKKNKQKNFEKKINEKKGKRGKLEKKGKVILEKKIKKKK
jgi:hypothetical protein